MSRAGRSGCRQPLALGCCSRRGRGRLCLACGRRLHSKLRPEGRERPVHPRRVRVGELQRLEHFLQLLVIESVGPELRQRQLVPDQIAQDLVDLLQLLLDVLPVVLDPDAAQPLAHRRVRGAGHLRMQGGAHHRGQLQLQRRVRALI